MKFNFVNEMCLVGTNYVLVSVNVGLLASFVWMYDGWVLVLNRYIQHSKVVRLVLLVPN